MVIIMLSNSKTDTGTVRPGIILFLIMVSNIIILFLGKLVQTIAMHCWRRGRKLLEKSLDMCLTQAEACHRNYYSRTGHCFAAGEIIGLWGVLLPIRKGPRQVVISGGARYTLFIQDTRSCLPYCSLSWLFRLLAIFCPKTFIKGRFGAIFRSFCDKFSSEMADH